MATSGRGDRESNPAAGRAGAALPRRNDEARRRRSHAAAQLCGLWSANPRMGAECSKNVNTSRIGHALGRWIRHEARPSVRRTSGEARARRASINAGEAGARYLAMSRSM